MVFRISWKPWVIFWTWTLDIARCTSPTRWAVSWRVRFTSWMASASQVASLDFLTRFKEIDAFWAADDDMAFGAIKAIDQADRKDIKVIFGGAGAKDMVKVIMDGTDPRIQADVSYSPKFIYDAIKLTAEARLKGEKLPATTIIPSVLIDKSNAKDFYYPDSPF